MLIDLRGSAPGGGAEDRVDTLGRLPDQVAERAVGQVLGNSISPLGLGLAGAGLHRPVPAAHGTENREADFDHACSFSQGQAKGERIGLDALVAPQLPGETQGELDAGDFDGPQAEVADDLLGVGALPREQVAAEVDPVAAAGLGLEPSAQAIGLLQQKDLVVAQLAGGGDPGRAASDDDHVDIDRGVGGWFAHGHVLLAAHAK